MALVTYGIHEPVGWSRSYVASVETVGYPITVLVCGSTHCEEPGLVWLVQEELDAYEAGERVFRIPAFAVRLRTT